MLWWAAIEAGATCVTPTQWELEHWSPGQAAPAVPTNALVRHWTAYEGTEVYASADGAEIELVATDVGVRFGQLVEWAPLDGWPPGASVDLEFGGFDLTFTVGTEADVTPPTWTGGWTVNHEGRVPRLAFQGLTDDHFSGSGIAILATEVGVERPYADADAMLYPLDDDCWDASWGVRSVVGRRFDVVFVDGAGNATEPFRVDVSDGRASAGCSVAAASPAFALLWLLPLLRRCRAT